MSTIIQMQKSRADQIAAKTEDAYSAARWGSHWRPLALFLIRRGYTDTQVEAILRSAYTRWASDAHDKTTTGAFKLFMRQHPKLFKKQAILELVAGTV